MVIYSSNSSSTLTSLDDVRKFSIENVHEAKSSNFLPSKIVIPDRYEIFHDFDKSPDVLLHDQANILYLPPQSDPSVDLYLRSIPEIMEAADEFLAHEPRHFTSGESQRILYVHQGEVAHATLDQCDIIVSDRATTCHILAFRSVSKNGPLVSMSHISDCTSDASIRSMVLEHIDSHDLDSNSIRRKNETSMNIDVFICGGFEDEEAISRKISKNLIHSLSRMASEISDRATFILQLCAITSINDTGFGTPIARGLGLTIQTGEACIASVDLDATGPALCLRSARLWSENESSDILSVIHTPRSNTLCINPFHYAPFLQMDTLLPLSDEILLQYVSTSPSIEDPSFCEIIRSTLRFIDRVPCESVFGVGCRQPVQYVRLKGTNQWKRVPYTASKQF
jgi:protein N-terminal asparagine amidohydrolase